jgi:hypothetical protein
MGTIRATWRISLREQREAHVGQTAIAALALALAPHLRCRPRFGLEIRPVRC